MAIRPCVKVCEVEPEDGALRTLDGVDGVQVIWVVGGEASGLEDAWR
jgi:hypothetical protein